MPPKRVREESDLFLLADAALHQGEVDKARRTMLLIALSNNTRCDSKEQQLVLRDIVIQRQGVKIYAHHITDPTVTYEMDKTPVSWIKWLKTIFTPKKQRCEAPEPVTVLPSRSGNEQNFETLLTLLSKLPSCNKLVIAHLEDGRIILQVLGRLLDAVITIENGLYYECDTVSKPGETMLRVPWVSPKPNGSLGSQMVMITKDAEKWFVEIHMQAGRLIGIHRYDCGGIVCLTTPNGVKKFSFNPNQQPSLDRKNDKLILVKTSEAPFDGTIKTFKGKVVNGYELTDGSLLPLSDGEPLDKVLSVFKQTGRL